MSIQKIQFLKFLEGVKTQFKKKAEQVIQNIFDLYSLGDDHNEKSSHPMYSDNPPYH